MNFDSLWNALPMPAFLIDADNRIFAANHAGEGFVIASQRSLAGKPCIDKITATAPLQEMFDRARNTNSAVLINDVMAGPVNQIQRRCNIHIAPVSTRDTQILLLFNLRDEREQSGPSGSAKSAIGMAEMLAHEIKNPLAGITGAAQLLAMNLPKADLEMTDLIVSEARRVVGLLDQVEQFGNQSPPKRVAVNIHDVLDRARKSAALGFAAHMRFRVDYDPSLPDTWADADQLIQVVLNLLKNAAQAGAKSGAKSGGEILLRSSFDNGMRLRRADGTGTALPILLEIIDNGPGIAADIANDIFAPFVSGRENGTGLGLALVSKIITDHQGWIAVDSVPGRTAFRISLPKAQTPKGKL